MAPQAPAGAEAAPSEYAAAREAAAVAELPERGVLAASGPQRLKFLHDILSNAILDKQPGQGCLAALMTVKGHVIALMRCLIAKDAVLLEMPADRLQRVEQTLLFYKVAAPVRFAAKPAAVIGLLGPKAVAVVRKAGVEVADLAAEQHVHGVVAGHEVLLARASDLPAGGYVLHAPPDAAAAVRDALLGSGAHPIGREALDMLRVEAGRPWYGPDVTEENLLHETGLLKEYASLTKGCYVGQEVVARLDARGGNVNKMMRGLRLGAPARAGDAVVADSKEVGRVTTAAVSPRLGPIALGYVHRKHVEPGTVVEVAGAPATVSALPMSE